MRAAIAVMTLLACLKLGDEFRRLVWQSDFNGAIDLRQRQNEVQRWFGGLPVYGEVPTAVYPPASYSMLWPLLGWLGLAQARWLWAVTATACLAWLSALATVESRARSRLERAFAALLPLSMNAAGVAVGNGQPIIHVLPLLIASVLLVQRRPAGWRRDLAAAFIFLPALVKPSLSAPFLWLLLLARGGLRVVLLVAGGYLGLTLLAARFQSLGVTALVSAWVATLSGIGADGYAELHTLLVETHHPGWSLASSGAALLALGAWVYRHRREDPWLLLGVTGVVARLWTYHRVYDDLLILLPMLSLCRITRTARSGRAAGWAAGLLAASVAAMLMPARLAESPWAWAFSGTHAVVWIAALLFLLVRARRERAQLTAVGLSGSA